MVFLDPEGKGCVGMDFYWSLLGGVGMALLNPVGGHGLGRLLEREGGRWFGPLLEREGRHGFDRLRAWEGEAWVWTLSRAGDKT